MTIQDKISQLLPSFLKRYDGNKDASILLANGGTLERYQKMLASEIDEFFLASTDNLHENTKAVTMPTKFLPYEEDLRGTSKLVFEFAPFIPVTPFDQTNLVFDFDFQKTSKQTLRDGIYLTNYIDRGLNFAQATASKQPTVTSEGILFDGIDDFLTTVATVAYPEVWAVLKNTSSGNFTAFQCAFSASSGLLADPRFSMLGNVGSTTLFTGQVDENRVNNIPTNEFSPLNQFKVWSGSRLVYNRDNFTIGATNGVVSGAQFWNGTIKRLLIFDKILSASRRTALQEYLAIIYNL